MNDAEKCGWNVGREMLRRLQHPGANQRDRDAVEDIICNEFAVVANLCADRDALDARITELERDYAGMMTRREVLEEICEAHVCAALTGSVRFMGTAFGLAMVLVGWDAMADTGRDLPHELALLMAAERETDEETTP